MMVSSIFFTRHLVTATNLGGATSVVTLAVRNLAMGQWKWNDEQDRIKGEVGIDGGEIEETSCIYKVE